MLTFDTIDILWQKTRELMTNLGIASIDPLLECLPDEAQREMFSNIINGYSPKAERLKAESQSQEQEMMEPQNAVPL